MNKLFWIKSNYENNWGSGRHLVLQYKTRYECSFDVREVSYDQFGSGMVLDADLYVFSELSYPWQTIVDKILKIPKGSSVIIHLYGSLISKLSYFALKQTHLKEYRISFVTGSLSSSEVLRNCLNAPEDEAYRPFSVNIGNNPLRKTGKDTVKHLFAGRISYYKNVHHLIDLFAQFSKTNSNHELHIVGLPDNVGWRNSPSAHYLNYAAEVFNLSLKKAVEDGARVIYHGYLEHFELMRLLTEMDIYTSLSLCEEEDFGMSIAEALVAHLEVVVTSWGGHKQFGNCVKKVPVAFEDGNLCINQEVLFGHWQSFSGESRAADFQDLNKRWATSSMLFQKQELFSGFTDEFLKLLSQSNFDKDFFTYAQDFLSPMWELDSR